MPAAKPENRIAKVMARAGVASRREAETLIEAGRVSVNGSVIKSPALNVKPSDRIAIDGKPMQEKERTRLFLFHKPRGLVTTSADTHDRPTIFGGLPDSMPRVVSIGRLDINTEGLLLLTNDGGLARALELPATGWLRRYRVRAFGKVTQEQLDSLKNGIEIDGIRYGAIEAKLEREQGANVWITFAMREGKNREIRNVLGHLGLAVNRLIRVSYGPFQLGELPDGHVEEVKTRTLREQIGERLAAIAGADFSGPVMEREERAPIGVPSRSPEVRAERSPRGERPQRGGESGRPEFKRDDRKRGGDDRGRPSFEGRHQRPNRDGGDRPPRRDNEQRARPDGARPPRGEERPQRHRDAPEAGKREFKPRFNARGRDDKKKTWRRPPQKRDDAPRGGENKRWPDHGGGERPQRHGGDERKSNYAGGERKPHHGGGERKPYQGGGDRKPHFGGGERAQRRDGGERKSHAAGERKPYQGGGDRKPHGDERKQNRGGGERKPYQGGERKPYQGSGGRKPHFGGDDHKPRQDRDSRPPRRDDRPPGGGNDRPRPPGKGRRPYHGKRDR